MCICIYNMYMSIHINIHECVDRKREGSGN